MTPGIPPIATIPIENILIGMLSPKRFKIKNIIIPMIEFAIRYIGVFRNLNNTYKNTNANTKPIISNIVDPTVCSRSRIINVGLGAMAQFSN